MEIDFPKFYGGFSWRRWAVLKIVVSFIEIKIIQKVWALNMGCRQDTHDLHVMLSLGFIFSWM